MTAIGPGDPSAIGIMEGAYFASKRELLQWLDELFGIQIDKIERCGDGVVYLKIVDRLFPNSIPMRRVKMDPRQEWERLHNLKILQSAFVQCGIKKPIDIDRLSKCQQLDNLEFLQWLKCYYDKVTGGPILPTQSTRKERNVSADVMHGGSASKPRATNGVRYCERPGNRYQRIPSQHGDRPRPITPHDQIERLHCLLREKERRIIELEEDLRDAQEDSDFYFAKLRRLELLCEEPKRTVFTVPEVEEILYASTEPDAEKLVEGAMMPKTQECDIDQAENRHTSKAAVAAV